MEITIEFLASVNPDCDYYPAGFDEAAWRQFREDASKFRTALSIEFGLVFDLFGESHIQDSTHGVEISFPDLLILGDGPVSPSIRISNHGRFYVLTVVRRLTSDTENRVKAMGERLGFRYTPESLFGLPFDQRERINGDLFNQLYDYV